MKLSKETEVEIRQLYQSYWAAYLSGDFETFATFLDDHIIIYGTAVGEIFSTKEEALKFYIATAEEMTGKAEFRNRDISIQAVGDTVVIYEQSQLYILIEDTWTYYGSARITGIFEQKSNGWKLVHQHGSFPDSRTEEGQQIASEKIKEENLQLRQAVKRRTVELENKNRELEIESSLERVRTVAMSMYKPDDMLQVCKIISEQLQLLGVVDIRNVQTAIIDERGKETYMNYQYFTQYKEGKIEEVVIASHPAVKDMIQHMQQSPDAFFTHSFEGDALEVWKQYRRDDHQFPDPILEDASAVHFYFYSIGQGGLGLSAYTQLSEEAINLFHRFRNVFALAYQRFRDIEQAEAQAREAQIEASLERVRTRSMAMQKSEELVEASNVLFNELNKLGIEPIRTGVGTIDGQKESIIVWSSQLVEQNEIKILGEVPRHAHPFFEGYYAAWQNKEPWFTYTMSGKEIVEYYKSMSSILSYPEKTEFNPQESFNVFFFPEGSLNVITPYPLSTDDCSLILRFAKVFGQIYRRFLDLKLAEAQAREARIEVALERVRSKAMAMHSSEDLAITVDTFFFELNSLGVTPRRCGVGIVDSATRTADIHATSATQDTEAKKITGLLKLSGHPVLENIFKYWERQEEYHPILRGREILDYYMVLNPQVSYPDFTEDETQYGYYFNFKEGGVFAWTDKPYGEDELNIFRKFTSVISLTYKRYMDLVQAEANAREAKIETSLERLRSRTMAMQSCDELAETASVVFKELMDLGISPNRLYIAIIENESKEIHFYLTNEDGGTDCSVYTAEIDKNTSIRKMYDGWATHQRAISIYMEGAELAAYFEYLKNELGIPFRNNTSQTRRVHKIAYFSQGYIGIASLEDQPQETTILLERFAAVFNLTYTRFNDLKQAEKLAHQATLDLLRLKEEKTRTELALTELKATQAQLIQSEKMASLGELTAGIAHEIQNPLNFVNNFSDVNTELIEEMKEELQHGNNAEAIAIANDIADNEQKINHHGKRADAIVKGMLQHSRSSSGIKEPTDINTLADEYLRLAYHGLRAKDKSFNATMKTDFDRSIGKVDVIPQDIGRVILNLITNAFYAVSEKGKTTSSDYEPMVIVRTQKLVPPIGGNGGQDITITVRDNGPGIPKNALDKIFQPFFTTKPTGQGTGLGLSLSYDIVKAHGGDLKVETKEGEGSVFTIQLPLVAHKTIGINV